MTRLPDRVGGVVVSGIGQSAVGRRVGRSPLDLTSEAALAAIAESGLTAADIDGVSTWPGLQDRTPGFSGVGVFELQDCLGLRLSWFSGGGETPGQLGAVVNAYAAIKAGLARHVVCFRTVWEATAAALSGARASVLSGAQRVGGWSSWLTPFGALSATNWAAQLATRHQYDYGTTREQLGALAVNQRANAAGNPRAVYLDPLTLEDYLAARMISDPLCLFDCDVPVDGSTAVVVSKADTATDLAKAPISIAGIGAALTGSPTWDQFGSLEDLIAFGVGRSLWASTDLSASDVDVAQLYDGFSILTLIWLEALGLVPVGESGRFVEGGTRIALDGQLPLNTGGGQLSAGRLHGFGHLHEAVVQLRGEGGARQVPGEPRVAVVAAGGGHLGGALLLRRD